MTQPTTPKPPMPTWKYFLFCLAVWLVVLPPVLYGGWYAYNHWTEWRIPLPQPKPAPVYRPVFTGEDAPAPRYTLAQFNQVTMGMAKAQVTAILGTGELVAENVIGEGEYRYHTANYSWRNPGGSSCSVMIQNGKVVSKSQYGLK